MAGNALSRSVAAGWRGRGCEHHPQVLFQKEAITCLLARICDLGLSPQALDIPPPGPALAPRKTPCSSEAQGCLGRKRSRLLLHLSGSFLKEL